MEKDKLYKEQILDSIKAIDDFIVGKSFEELGSNRLLRDGILHELQIIGEASRRFSKNFKDRTDIPWQDVSGIRDKIVHDYFTVNLKVIWDTIQNDLPELKQKLEDSK